MNLLVFLLSETVESVADFFLRIFPSVLSFQCPHVNMHSVCLLVVSLCCPFSLLFPLTLKPIKDSYFEVDGCLFISLKLVHLLKGKSNLTGYCTKKPNNRPTSLAFFCVHKAKELHPSICIELTQSSKHNLIYS